MTDKDNVKVTMYKIANRLKERLGYSASKETEGFLAPAAIEEADKLIAQVCATCPETISKHWISWPHRPACKHSNKRRRPWQIRSR